MKNSTIRASSFFRQSDLEEPDGGRDLRRTVVFAAFVPGDSGGTGDGFAPSTHSSARATSPRRHPRRRPSSRARARLSTPANRAASAKLSALIGLAECAKGGPTPGPLPDHGGREERRPSCGGPL